MVVMEPPDGGTGEVTVTATGPPPVPAHTLLAVLCWYEDTAIRSAWRVELVTDSRYEKARPMSVMPSPSRRTTGSVMATSTRD
jgi:hypothetical protein